MSQLNEGLCHPKALGVSASSDDDATIMPPSSEVGLRKDSSCSSSSADGRFVNQRSFGTSTVGDTGGGVGTSNGNARWCWGYGGDFGNKLEQMSDGPFCMNGLVDADRTLHPGTAEVRELSIADKASKARCGNTGMMTVDATVIGAPKRILVANFLFLP